MHLDLIGKKFADNCLFASIYRLGKSSNCSAGLLISGVQLIERLNVFIENFTRAYDTETLLTRMLLKGMIEYLSSQMQPGALEAVVLSLNELQQNELKA